jgi:hypothetical protein
VGKAPSLETCHRRGHRRRSWLCDFLRSDLGSYSPSFCLTVLPWSSEIEAVAGSLPVPLSSVIVAGVGHTLLFAEQENFGCDAGVGYTLLSPKGSWLFTYFLREDQCDPGTLSGFPFDSVMSGSPFRSWLCAFISGRILKLRLDFSLTLYRRSCLRVGHALFRRKDTDPGAWSGFSFDPVVSGFPLPVFEGILELRLDLSFDSVQPVLPLRSWLCTFPPVGLRQGSFSTGTFSSGFVGMKVLIQILPALFGNAMCCSFEAIGVLVGFLRELERSNFISKALVQISLITFFGIGSASRRCFLRVSFSFDIF